MFSPIFILEPPIKNEGDSILRVYCAEALSWGYTVPQYSVTFSLYIPRALSALRTEALLRRAALTAPSTVRSSGAAGAAEASRGESSNRTSAVFKCLAPAVMIFAMRAGRLFGRLSTPCTRASTMK